MNIPLVYIVEVIGFYKLHYCSSNETNEFFFLNISLLYRTLAFTAGGD